MKRGYDDDILGLPELLRNLFNLAVPIIGNASMATDTERSVDGRQLPFREDRA